MPKDVFKDLPSFLEETDVSLFQMVGKLNLNDIKLVIPHQASGTAVQAYSKIGGFNTEQIMYIIDKYGNCVSASIPLALSIAVENRKINRGDLIIMIGTGAGLSVSGCLIKF